MKAAIPSNTTRILATDQEEYHELHIVDMMNEELNQPYMCSLWRPDADELVLLNEGGFVQLSIAGTVHPPVGVTTVGPGTND